LQKRVSSTRVGMQDADVPAPLAAASAPQTSSATGAYEEIGKGFCFHDSRQYSGYWLFSAVPAQVSAETCQAICSALDWCIAVAHIVLRGEPVGCRVYWYWTEGQWRLMPLASVLDDFDVKVHSSNCQAGSNHDWDTWKTEPGDLLCDPNNAAFCYDGDSCTTKVNLCGNCDSTVPPNGAKEERNYDNSTCFAKPACATLWGKCGGINWQGPVCCEAGTECVKLNPHYSQCQLISPDWCVGSWHQCGGKGYDGPTNCCVASQKCTVVNDNWSNCQ